MPDPLVAIHIVTWNSQRHLAGCFDALVRQTYPSTQIMVVDNASVDGTVSWLEEHFPHIHVLRNTRNVGFCRAHNQAIRLSNAPYVLLLNPDVILDREWLARGVHWLENHPEYGSFGGKLRRFTYSNDELTMVEPSDILDTTGLVVSRSRHTADRGTGETDHGQHDRPEDVFGHSGACVLFRREALETVRDRDMFLDEAFFAYKEDVDIAWRLQRLGWGSWYDPQALGYHHRHVRGISHASDALLAKNARGRTGFIAWYSYRNHWLTLLKNETWATTWRDLPWIGGYELRKFLYYLVARPMVLRVLGTVIRSGRNIRRQRFLLQKHSKQSPQDIRRRFFLHS